MARYGQVAQGNDFHRREQDLAVIAFRDKADRKHKANMKAWGVLHKRAMARGDYTVAANIMREKLIPNVA